MADGNVDGAAGRSYTKDLQLLVVGDASLDFVVRVPHIAGPDNKAIGQFAGVYGGGMSANLAAAAARHGAETALITKVGCEPEAQEALDDLERLGIDTGAVLVDQARRTWTCFIQLDESGEKALVGADTGAKLPSLGEIDMSVVERARLVAPLADDLEWAAAIAERADSAGAEVAIDLEPDAIEPGDARLESLLKLSAIVFVNRDSAHKLGDSVEAAAKLLLSKGVRIAIVSLGAEGAYCATNAGESFTVKVATAVKAVDTTGAGDALAGTFLAGYLAGLSARECLTQAVEASAACVQQLGSRTYLELNTPRPAAFVEHGIPGTTSDMEENNAN